MIKVLIVRYGIMQIERANMLKSKILNIVYGVLFGLLSYVIIMVMTVVFQQNDLSIWLSNFSFFFAFIYGIISICVRKTKKDIKFRAIFIQKKFSTNSTEAETSIYTL